MAKNIFSRNHLIEPVAHGFGMLFASLSLTPSSNAPASKRSAVLPFSFSAKNGPCAPDQERSLSLPYLALLQLYALLVYPSVPVMLAQLYYTRVWFPAGPNFLHSLLLNFLPLIFLALFFVLLKKERPRILLWKAAALVIFIIFTLCMMTSMTHMLLFKCHISFLSFQAILQTDANEAFNFALSTFSYREALLIFLAVVVYLFLFIFFWRRLPKAIGVITGPKTALALVLVGLAAIPIFALTIDKYNNNKAGKNNFLNGHFVFRDFREFAKALENELHVAGMREYAAMKADFGEITLLDQAQKRTYVLILGEGASRNHMSLYGYGRPTSHELDQMRDRLLVYDRVISVAGTTAPSLNAAFLFHELQEEGKGILSVVSLHREAGFRTYWLNNNLAAGMGKGPAWFNISADIVININVSSSFTQPSTYDEAVLPEFKRMLADPAPDKFIVVHLAGMHPTYSFRYPPEAAVFKDKDAKGLFKEEYPDNLYEKSQLDADMIKKINEYDNAMTYNNKVVAELFQMVEDLPGSNYVLYISDHSQQLYETRGDFVGHAPTSGTQYMYNIPFVLYLSPEYRRDNMEFSVALAAGRHRFWKLDESFGHGMAELSRIYFARFAPERSIFSQRYRQPDTLLRHADYNDLEGGFNIEKP